MSVERIIHLYNSGELVKNIAMDLGVSDSYVCAVARRHGLRRHKKRTEPLRHKRVPQYSKRTIYKKPLRGPNYQEQRYVLHLPHETH